MIAAGQGRFRTGGLEFRFTRFLWRWIGKASHPRKKGMAALLDRPENPSSLTRNDMGIGDESNHTYVITSVPKGCEAYVVGQRIRVYVSNPPPQSIVLNYGNQCDGIVATLAS
jgi:hypothetical protein